MKKSLYFTVCAVITALVFALLTFTTVYAEGETPDSPVDNTVLSGETTETQTATLDEQIPAETVSNSEEQNSEVEELESVCTDEDAETLCTGDSLENDAIVSEVSLAPEDSSANILLEEKPAEEDSIVISDANGDPMDMASQASADTIASGDPWWMVGLTKYAVVFNQADCPAGTSYGSTCWVSTTPINEALHIIDDQ